jgi:hypothetical protein
VTDPDQTDSQPVSQPGRPARRPIIGPVDLRAELTFEGQVRVPVPDDGGELPGTAVHGGLLHGIGLLIGKAASPGWVISS